MKVLNKSLVQKFRTKDYNKSLEQYFETKVGIKVVNKGCEQMLLWEAVHKSYS